MCFVVWEECIAGAKIVGNLEGQHSLPITDLSSALDISADLQELARSRVGMVSAGAKSILDIGRYVLHAKIH